MPDFPLRFAQLLERVDLLGGSIKLRFSNTTSRYTRCTLQIRVEIAGFEHSAAYVEGSAPAVLRAFSVDIDRFLLQCEALQSDAAARGACG